MIALAEDPLEVAVQIFHVRGGRVRGERGWVADRFDEGGTGELVEQFLLQLYADVDPPTPDRDAVPREILVPVAAAVAGAARPSCCQRAPRVARARSGCRSAATSGR